MKYFLVFLGSFCIASNLLLFYLKFDEINVSDEAFLNAQRCPYCFGNSICDTLNVPTSNLHIVADDSLSNTYFLQRLFNVKNVFFGTEILSNKKIVFKKLAHNSELELFDLNEKNCSNVKGKCISRFVRLQKGLIQKRLNVFEWKEIGSQLDIEMTKCLSKRLVKLMYSSYSDQYQTRIDYNKTSKYFDLNIVLLSVLKINPEPIVLNVSIRLF